MKRILIGTQEIFDEDPLLEMIGFRKKDEQHTVRLELNQSITDDPVLYGCSLVIVSNEEIKASFHSEQLIRFSQKYSVEMSLASLSYAIIDQTIRRTLMQNSKVTLYDSYLKEDDEEEDLFFQLESEIILPNKINFTISNTSVKDWFILDPVPRQVTAV